MERTVAVNSTLGPVAPERLGTTLIHEHVFVLSPEIQHSLPEPLPRARMVEFAVARLAEARAAGVDTVVDATIIGQGRDAALVREVAAASDVTVVTATGLFVHDELPPYFRFRRPRPDAAEDALTEMFIRDVTEGIGTTGIRAGVLKCATERRHPTADALRVIRATARAHLATGVAIITHTAPRAESGLALAEVFKAEGVDPGRVVLGHSGDTDDVDHLRALLAAGYTLGMDRFGYDHVLDQQTRVKIVAQLCAEGYAGQLTLSHDAPTFIDYFQDNQAAGRQAVGDFTLLHRTVLGELRAAGVRDEDIRRMLVDNPRRLLTPVVPAARP